MKKSLLAFPLFLLSLAAQASGYQAGFVWDRLADWTPGTTPGAAAGNADDDQLGNPTWFYGNVRGGDGLGGSTPWYTLDASAQVWDDAWTGAVANQAWARAYNGPGAPKIGANPPITRGNMIHDLSQNTGSYNYKPEVRWLNPAGNGAIVDITGELTVTWNGFGLTSYPDIPVEVAFARFDASANQYDLLYSSSVVNPQAGQSFAGVVRLGLPDLNLNNLRFDEGDFLVYSVRGVSGPQWPAAWVGLTDKVKVTLVSQVPEPAEWASMLAGLAVVSLAMRRRQRGAVAV